MERAGEPASAATRWRTGAGQHAPCRPGMLRRPSCAGCRGEHRQHRTLGCRRRRHTRAAQELRPSRSTSERHQHCGPRPKACVTPRPARAPGDAGLGESGPRRHAQRRRGAHESPRHDGRRASESESTTCHPRLKLRRAASFSPRWHATSRLRGPALAFTRRCARRRAGRKALAHATRT